MSHFAVQQKLTQHCKSTILQLKKNFLKGGGVCESFPLLVMLGFLAGALRRKTQSKRPLTAPVPSVYKAALSKSGDTPFV